MNEHEADELYTTMLEHKDIFPTRIKLEHIFREIPDGRGGEAKDYGVGVKDPLVDTRINLWDENGVEQFMSTYMAKLREARDKRRRTG